mgnify:CR=1 FL=1
MVQKKAGGGKSAQAGQKRRRGSGGRPGSPGYPAEVRNAFWAAVAAGHTISEAGPLVGVWHTTGIRWFHQCGGVRPRPTKPRQGYLTITDRSRINELLAEGRTAAAIGRALGRPTSTITRELARGRDAHGTYLPWLAQNRLEQAMRRPKARKVDADPVLAAEVATRLGKKHSPEQIAARLRIDFPDDESMRLSHESIYQALYVQARGLLNVQVKDALRTGRARRRPQGRTRKSRNPFPDMLLISDRPAEAEDRAVPGHWEGDLITGAYNASAIGTLVERSTGFTVLLHLPGDHTATTTAAAMSAAVPKIPELLRRSLTWDRGSEMALHTQITAATGLPIYFADPHSPWQRGTNENTNGLLRQYFPKGTDLSVHGPGILDNVAAELNARPRERLSWATPAEKLQQLLSQGQDPEQPVAPTA